MSTISPNMGLIVPTVGVEPDPDWANELNADLSILDGHNHAAGQGVQITPSGLNLNADVSFLSNNAISLRAARFTAQVSPIPNSGSDVGEVYVSGNELYYNDVSGGNQVQITSNGSVNAGSGSISGLPSGTASASFSASTFVWQSATSTAANMDAGSYILRNSSASSKGLTLQPPNSMAANYALTLPSLPASQSFMTVDTSGNMSGYAAIANGLTGSNIVSNVNLSGKTVQAGSHNVVVSNTNSSTNGLCIVRGYVTYSGTTPVISSGEGFTPTFNAGTGIGTLTFTTAFSDIPSVMFVPVQSNTGDDLTTGLLTLSTSAITFQFGSGVRRAYCFIAIGIIA